MAHHGENSMLIEQSISHRLLIGLGGEAHRGDPAIETPVLRSHDVDSRYIAYGAHPQVAQMTEARAFGRSAAQGPVFFEDQGQGEQGGAVGCAVGSSRAHVSGRIMRWEARRVGKECVSRCRSRWRTEHKK